MQALRILPLLMSMFAAAISLLAEVGPGAIIDVDFIMLSDVQAIIAADAGETTRETTKPESMVAATNILI